MHEYLEDLHELCETIGNEIGEANDKIRSAGGQLSGSDLDYIDKLTHAMKSIKTTIAMMESEDDGYSGRPYPYRMTYARRGRMRRNGRYSRDDGMIDDLREMMKDAPNEKTKMEFERFIKKMEQM